MDLLNRNIAFQGRGMLFQAFILLALVSSIGITISHFLQKEQPPLQQRVQKGNGLRYRTQLK